MQFFAEGGKDPFRLLPLVAATFPKGTAFGGGGKVSGRAKGPILEGAVERSETGGVLLKKQNAQVPKNLCVMAGVVSFELTARGFGDRCSTS